MPFIAYDKDHKELARSVSLAILIDETLQQTGNAETGYVTNADGTVVYGRKPAGMIKLEPKWRGVLPLLIEALTNGTEAGQRAAREELARMAEAADRYNASIKEE